MSLTDLDYRTILTEYRKKCGECAFADKSSILFTLKSKYGNMFDIKIGEKIYQEIKEKHDN